MPPFNTEPPFSPFPAQASPALISRIPTGEISAVHEKKQGATYFPADCRRQKISQVDLPPESHNKDHHSWVFRRRWAITVGEPISSSDAACFRSYRNSTCLSSKKIIQDLFFKTVCYSDVGCFNTGPPFYDPIRRPISVLPLSPEVLQVRYQLYTRRNRDQPIFLETGDVRKLSKSTFDPKAITRIIAHGWFDGDGLSLWGNRIKDSILDVSDDNVIVFDWIAGSIVPLIAQVASNARVAGALVANFILFLNEETGITPERFHLIGHSAGAQLFGYTGERVRNIGRITGLDPPGPYFDGLPPEVVLDPSDAVFVDILHTNSGTLGTTFPNGHTDFWPWNGRAPVSGCLGKNLENAVEDTLEQEIGTLGVCMHLFSEEYFIYSFNQNNCLFVGTECGSWEEFLGGGCDCGPNGDRCNFMGFFAQPRRRSEQHNYYLVPSNIRPYCVHQYVVNIYVHTTQQNVTLANGKEQENVAARITLIGLKNVLRTKINLRISYEHRQQKLSFLLADQQPLGKVHSAFLDVGHDGNVSPENGLINNITRYSLEKIRVTYLFPLPKTETEVYLCRMHNCTEELCGNQFLFRESLCPTYMYENKL